VAVITDDANLFYIEDFIQKWACLVHIFENLSKWNKSWQSPQINTLTWNDKVNAFVKILEFQERNNATFFLCFLLLKDAPAMKWKLRRNFSSATFVLCRNSVQCILKMSVPKDLNGLGTHLLLTSPD
jgi:hypothetical protein